MKQIPAAIIDFLRTQSFTVVCSIDRDGFPHSSCKDIVKIEPCGQVFLLDAYHGLTAENIRANPRISVSAVDEHKFIGYCLKGKAKILPDNNISREIIKSWEDNITSRLVKRLLKNLAEGKGRGHHPEVSLPRPKYLISIEVEKIVNLTPRHLRKEG